MSEQVSEQIVVGMSGGVDSSVAAALLVEQGFAVVGITLRVTPWAEPGDPVRLKDVDIGQVGAVDLDRGQVRVEVRLDREHAGSLPRDSAFTVESSGIVGRRRWLEAHVLDPGSPPIADGQVVEGSGSKIEIALRQAARKASDAIDRAAESDWARKGAEKVDQVLREIEAIDCPPLGTLVNREGFLFNGEPPWTV